MPETSAGARPRGLVDHRHVTPQAAHDRHLARSLELAMGLAQDRGDRAQKVLAAAIGLERRALLVARRLGHLARVGQLEGHACVRVCDCWFAQDPPLCGRALCGQACADPRACHALNFGVVLGYLWGLVLKSV